MPSREADICWPGPPWPKPLSKTLGTLIILSPNPIEDTGGGQRSAQIAAEFLRRGFQVHFVSHDEVSESVDLHLRFKHPHFHPWALEEFELRHAIARHQSGTILALTQVPLASWMPTLKRLRKHGGLCLFDLIDNWDSSLGGTWYRRKTQKKMARYADFRTASAAALQKQLKEQSGKDAYLWPNAVNTHLFCHHPKRPKRPGDLPQTGNIVMYVGALWGDWFNWPLLRQCAQHYSQTQFVLVGDYRGEFQHPPPNCHFLGLKAQADLPNYLSHANAAFIPWHINHITQSTSPLKIYEYLAMGLPVLAPNIEPLRGIPNTHLAKDDQDFVHKLGQLRPLDDDARQQSEAFIQANSWRTRIDDILNWSKALSPKAQRPFWCL